MTETVRIGIIGGMGRGPYVGQMFNETGKAAVVAVADVNPKSFEVGRERFATCGANPALYTDVAEMLRRDDLDWVIVGTPDRTHFALAKQAIEAGKNVFVEKPLTQTTADADELCRLVARRGVKLVVGFELRFAPMAVAFRNAVARGMIGRPVIGLFIDHLGRGYTYFLRDHRQKRWGRGLLMQKGVHSLDLVNYYVDSDPVRVFGTGGLDFYGREPAAAGRHCRDCSKKDECRFSFYTVESATWKKGGPREKGDHAFDHCVFMPDTDAEDNMHLVVDYASGFRLTYTSVYFAPVYNRHEVMLWGTEGSLHGVMEGGADRIVFTPIGGAHEMKGVEVPVERSVGGHGGGDVRFAEAIVAATLGGAPIRPDVYDGRAAVALAEFGLKSIETGRPIAIPPRP